MQEPSVNPNQNLEDAEPEAVSAGASPQGNADRTTSADFEAAKKTIAAKRLTSEWSELHDWWGTPEGDEIAGKYRDGEWSRERVQDYLDARNRGETHAQAMEAGFGATAKRIGKYIMDFPDSFAKFQRNPLGMLGQQFSEKREKVGIEGTPGDALTTLWLVGDIMWSTVPATVEAAGRLSRGTGTGEDVFHLAEMTIPLLRGSVSRVIASRLAKGTVGSGKRVFLPGKVWQEVLKELTPEQIEQLKTLKIWDGKFEMLETGVEAVALALEIEELPQELIGTGMMRVFAETGARFYNTDKSSSDMWTDALEGAFADYASEAEVDPDAQQATTPPDMGADPDAAADPDTEEATEETSVDTDPDADAAADPDTELETEDDVDTEAEPDAETETDADAEAAAAGAAPEVEPETEPEAEPETETEADTDETADSEAETEEPETETEPEGEPEVEPESEEETTHYSTAFTQMVERIASDPEIQAAETAEARAALIDARWKQLWPEIEKIPEYIREGDLFLNLFGNEIDKRIEEIKTETTGELEGTPNRVVWSSDRKNSYQVTYQLAELDDVQASHNLDGTKNPKFPPELQPREQRGGAMSLSQIAGYAKDLVTDFLLDHFSTLSDGAPLLSRQHAMRVLSGNGRTMALKKAFADHPEQWQKYQDALREKAAQYGITEEQINAMSNPVLVQVVAEDVNEIELADDANKSSGLEITSAEQASRDAKYLTDAVMAEWKFVGGSFEEALNHESNNDFRAALFKNIPHKEQSGFLASDNQSISAQGIARLRRMMFRYVFAGEYGIKLSQTLIETRFDNLKNINNMLDVAIPYLAKMESYIRSGIRAKDFSIAEELARAIGTMEQMAENGDSLSDMLRQDLLFTPKTSLGQLSVEAIQMLYMMDAKQNAYVQLASVFMRYSQAVVEQDPNQLSLVDAFTKHDFFKQEMFTHLWDAPPDEIQAAMTGKSIPEIRRIVEEHVDSLISLMEEQAKKRGAEPETEEPEGEAAAEEGESEDEAATDEGEPETEESEISDDELDARILAGIGESTHITEIVNATGLTIEQVSTGLLRLELAGKVQQLPGKRFSKIEGAETEPEGEEETPQPEVEVEPPTFPENPTLQLIAYTPASQQLRSRRGYLMEEQPDVDIWVTKERDGYFVTIDPPGYFAEQIFVSSRAPFTDKTARRVIQEALASAELSGRQWKLDENDPRKDGGVPEPNSAEQARIDRMPSVKEESTFVDGYVYEKKGLAYSMPSLDPAMKLKTIYEGGGRYTIYIESDAFAPELENLGSEPTRAVTTLDYNPIFRHADTDRKGNRHGARLILRGIRGKNPVDALQRGLAQVFDESVWDNLKGDPETEASIDRAGVPGNYPAPLPSKVKLVHDPKGLDDKVFFNLADESNNVLPDYRVEVNLDSLGIGDDTIEVIISFPNHSMKISAISEMATTGNGSVESAVLKTIANLRQYDFGKGGINVPGVEVEPETSTTEGSEALFEEGLPPVITNRERPFGDITLDTETMAHEGYPKGGNLKIYKFAGEHAPQARVRKMGTRDNPQWEIELRHPRRNAARHVSYAKTPKAAITDAVNAIENSDHAWKPVYKQGIFAQLDNVMNAINRRQFASTPAIERRIRGLFYNLRRGLKIDLRGYTISSLKELAILGQVWRHPGLEASRIVFLDENYQIIGHETVSIGVPGQTVSEQPPRVFYHMNRLNATYFVDMHNHPGGIAEFSDGDKDAARQIHRIYGKAYLGQVVVDSGEYAISRPVGDKVQHRSRIQFTESDLGWDVGQKPSTAATYSLNETAIRPADPLYQYDVDTETGKLLSEMRELRKTGSSAMYSRPRVKTDAMLKNMAKLGKYLQTEKNWTTLFFTGYDKEILAVKDYKDLHLLSPAELYNFIETEARMEGGVFVSAFIGEGDWYKTKQDIRNSPWGEVLTVSGRNEVSQPIGIEHAWFDGLEDDASAHVLQPGAAILSMYDTKAARGIGGDLYDTRIDSDYGSDTELTKPSEKRVNFIQKLIAGMENGRANARKLYEETTGQPIPSERLPLFWSFVQAVMNAFARTKNINPNVESPTAAGDFYNTLWELAEKTIANFLDDGIGKDVIVEVTRSEASARSHFTATRLANITENDRVLTLGDNDGTLATFARNAGAKSVETLTTDGYTKMIFNDILTDVADTVHEMSAENLAREWQGNRPTVILVDSIESAHHKLDEAMKVLAPGGRVVVISYSASWRYAPSNFWGLMSAKYRTYHLDVKEEYYSHGYSSAPTRYVVMDKQKGTVGVRYSEVNEGNKHHRVQDLFREVEAIKKARAPIVEADAEIEYRGIAPHEQTYHQPTTNPDVPANLAIHNEPLGIPSDVSQPGTVAGDVLPRQRQPLPRIEAQPVNTMPPQPEPVEANGTDYAYTAYGAPLIRTVQAAPPPVPDDTPTGVSAKIEEWVRKKQVTPEWYARSPQTAKRTLELLGSTGIAVGEGLKRIRNVGDRLTGRGLSVLDVHFPKWKQYVRAYASEQKIPLRDAAAALNQILARHQEGRSKTAVPKIMDDIVKDVSSFFRENIANPMLEMNKAIFKQGLLFEMPESLVDDGILENEFRKELERDLPSFEEFIKRAGMDKTKGFVQGFVRERETGKMFAVFVKSDTYHDPKTNKIEMIPGSDTYYLESPFGEERDGEFLMLHGTHRDYELIALRDPRRRNWTGDRDVAKQLWDAELTNSPRPDVLAEYFAEVGIVLPEGVRFKYSKIANVEEWSVRKDGIELYRIRRLTPIVEKIVSTPQGKFEQIVEADPAYDAFKKKLLVYKAGQVRNPIFIYRGRVPHKVWQPIDDYYPHTIDWSEMSPDPNDTVKYAKFTKFAEDMAAIQSNDMDVDMAKAFLTQRIAESKTRKYGHLEQDRQYNYPVYNRNFFQVWEQYIARAGHRLQTIREFGQTNDLLYATLNEFIAEDTLTEGLTPEESAVLKLRFFAGYRDFVEDSKGPDVPFRDKAGNPVEIAPHSDDFSGVSPQEWQLLVDAGILEVTDTGNYRATAGGVAMLENPAFLHGALAEGLKNLSIASDIVKNQLGWRQGDMFDEYFSDMVRGMRTWTGIIYLGRAWASNIAQSVNTGLVTGPKALLKAMLQLTDPKHRTYAKETGSIAIDVMHDYAGSATLGNRVIRQMLGAVPKYQVGRISPRSLLPTRGAIEDMGVRTQAWTPFYAVESLNRRIAALAGRGFAVSQLREMVRNPKRAKTARERLLSMPGAYALKPKLEAALSIPKLTTSQIERVSEMTEDEVRRTAPHLFPVYDFLAEFAKETADWTQHRVEAIDRGRPWTRHSIFIMMQQLQSFNFAQTKFVKDAIIREWEIAHAFLSENASIENKNVARTLGTLWFLPRVALWSGVFGFGAEILGKIVRFQRPDEDSLSLLTWLYKAGMYTQLGEYITQFTRFNRGAEEAFLGPTLGTAADFVGDPGRTAARLARPPLAGPSVQQVMDWVKSEDTAPRRRASRGGRRAPGQRRTIRR